MMMIMIMIICVKTSSEGGRHFHFTEIENAFHSFCFVYIAVCKYYL